MKNILYLMSFFMLLGCTHKGMYESTQVSNRIECSQLPASEYDECMERANVPYAEYERKRQELLRSNNVAP